MTRERSQPIRLLVAAGALVVAGLAALPAPAQDAPKDGLIGQINLATSEGVAQVKGQWRFHLVETGVGPKKNQIEPKAHGAFDDSQWEVVKPETLKEGRGPGKYSFAWYRIKVTIPDLVGGKPFSGGPVWFQTTVDDYGEVWVNGAIDLAFGKTGRGAVSGFNTPNRVRLQVTDEKEKKKRDPRPGDEIQIAVLGVNGPIGNPPANKIFLHGFTGLQFYAPDAPKAGENVPAVAAAPEGKEVAKLNLLNPKDVDLLKGQWRFKLIDVHTGPDQNEIEPKAHGAFDDKSWEVLDPATLGKARGPGNFSMAWYRLAVTLPEKVGDTSVAGTAAWFRTTVDDYGEVWVNGKIDLAPGRAGRGAISGFNRLNEVLLTDNVKPGETVQIAVLGINSPWGNPPGNNIFLRPTEIRFYQK
jgi:hypothetical protein